MKGEPSWVGRVEEVREGHGDAARGRARGRAREAELKKPWNLRGFWRMGLKRGWRKGLTELIGGRWGEEGGVEGGGLVGRFWKRLRARGTSFLKFSFTITKSLKQF